MTRAIQKYNFYLFSEKYFKSYGNINAIWPLFGMGSGWKFVISIFKILLSIKF